MSARLSDLVQLLDDLACVAGVEVLSIRLSRERDPDTMLPRDVADVHAGSQADAARLAGAWGLVEGPREIRASNEPDCVYVWRSWSGHRPPVISGGAPRGLRVTGADCHTSPAMRVG